MGLGLPRTFIRWLRFCAGKNTTTGCSLQQPEAGAGQTSSLPAHPPGLSLLQGGALGLYGVVNDAAGPPGEIHGDQRVLGHTPLWRERCGGGGRVRGRQRSEVKQARHSQSYLHAGTLQPEKASRVRQFT